MTWLVLCGAFALWLALAGTALMWARSILQHSTRPAPTVLSHIAGVVLYREAGQRTEISAHPGIELFDGDELVTSPGATASLRSFDGTTITVFPEARLRVEAARVGRFNAAATEAAYVLLAGTVRVSVPTDPDQPHNLRIAVPGASVSFTPGEYTVRVSPEATRISAWDGSAQAVVGDAPVQIREDHKLIVGAAGAADARVVDLLENVVRNGTFTRSFEAWHPWEDREQGRPDVPGHLRIVNPSEPDAPSHALRIYRDSVRDAHNETGLRQTLGRDVVGARAIRLEATIRVDYASLSGGGYLGSEYPLMLRVRARDRRGGEQTWIRGFYYANPENRPTPSGQLVPQAQWVKFSADLTDVFGQASTIDTIDVFGAGHTFDASIGALELLVD